VDPDRVARTLLVVAHPDRDSFTHAVARRLGEVAAAWGSVETADLHSEGFDPRFTLEDRRHYRGERSTPPADVVAEQARLDRATDLVLVFPLFWWSAPALLKGWVDRVFSGGWAFDIDETTGLTPRLQRLTTHVVAVAASDEGLLDRHGYDAALRTQLAHGVLDYCGSPRGAFVVLHDGEDARADLRAARVEEVVEAVRSAYAGRPGAD
jgi:NAD(P)H dehydrogenase (quinone)